MPFSAVYHHDVKARDIPKLNADVRQRIRRAIENRLLIAPQEYGEPLRKTLKGYWKLRVGDYRIVFKVVEKEIYILGICHRKQICLRANTERCYFSDNKEERFGSAGRSMKCLKVEMSRKSSYVYVCDSTVFFRNINLFS
jgi:mRNA interferase RelE/StbE